MLNEELIKKLKDLIDEYSTENKEPEENCEEKEPELKNGKMVVIKGKGEMPEELEELIDFIRRG